MLVLPSVFKTDEAQDLGLEGSIPFRLRNALRGSHVRRSTGGASYRRRSG